jgi:predicted secreted acid phosphatase
VTARIRLGLLAAALSAVPLAATATAHEPAQPATPEQIIEFYEGGHFKEEVDALTASATRSLKAQLRKKPRKPAIVFDIDDTLESTYDCAKRSDFNRNAISACQAQADQTPITQVWKLLKYAQKKKVALVIITGRPEGLEQVTRDQLKRDSLRGRYTLVMRPNDEFGQPSQPYKAAARKAIQKKGFKILVNIGDQQSDLDGGSAAKRFKVPNPMYFTP